jgi:hypothetical protein
MAKQHHLTLLAVSDNSFVHSGLVELQFLIQQGSSFVTMLLECLNWSSAFQDNHSHTLPDFD